MVPGVGLEPPAFGDVRASPVAMFRQKVSSQHLPLFSFLGVFCRQVESLAGDEQMSKESVKCPRCSSQRLFRDGVRYIADSLGIQRWLCRDCGYRFSEKYMWQLIFEEGAKL
jgi:DNA-directed RNA polymerase subunit RPC12/RpoP